MGKKREAPRERKEGEKEERIGTRRQGVMMMMNIRKKLVNEEEWKGGGV